jgi:phage protein D
MKPVFHIEVDRPELSAAVRDRLVELTIEDAAGYENDTLNITLDGRDPFPKMPKAGAILTVYLGYDFIGDGNSSRTFIPPTLMGRYELGEIEWEGPPWNLILHATSMSMMNIPKSSQQTIYEDKTLAEIVEQCSREMSYEPDVHPRYRDIYIKYEAQKGVSHMEFLNALAMRYAAMVKVQNQKLRFYPKTYESEVDQLLSTWQVIPKSFRYSTQVRSAYSAVMAASFSLDTGKLTRIETQPAAGLEKGANSAMELLRQYEEVEKARAAAESKRVYLDNANDAVEFKVGGNPLMQSHRKIELEGEGWHPDIPKKWIVVNATHKFTKGRGEEDGYTTAVKCEILKAEDSGQRTDDNTG